MAVRLVGLPLTPALSPEYRGEGGGLAILQNPRKDSTFNATDRTDDQDDDD
jgi:hypothetical protein